MPDTTPNDDDQNNDNTPEGTDDDGGPKTVKDSGIKPPLQAIAVSTGVIAVAAAAAAVKYLAG